jgi:hypothetical protein
MVEWWSGGVVEWWSGGVVEWWSGGVVEWWSGGVVERWSGGAVERWCGGAVVRWCIGVHYRSRLTGNDQRSRTRTIGRFGRSGEAPSEPGLFASAALWRDPRELFSVQRSAFADTPLRRHADTFPWLLAPGS